ncbi:Hypothetical protein NTJ_12869 [Nesidiocoris tenuis]|uniref:C2H2-type domain-containing protein n=1 Tax=Nesidiocoris tenuis TaxID=355587 RepID=A0ABN7B8S0_9HEMI|nr:Hypothetical protein NTJ_12869 [Nesidiocoris tenuis]
MNSVGHHQSRSKIMKSSAMCKARTSMAVECNSEDDSRENPEEGLPLLSCQTTFSRVCLGEKLQEIMGDEFIVLISAKDAVCWGCAKYINWVDKCERELDTARAAILKMVIAKYKNSEINVTNLHSELQESAQNRVSNIGNINSTNLGYDAVKERRKDFNCPVCFKIFTSAAALGVHKSRQHPTQRSCEYCGLILSTDAKYRAHVAKHVIKIAPTAQKMMNCVTCGFQTKDMEAYCRHVCDSKIVNMVCQSCRKRYIRKSSMDATGKNLCNECIVLDGAKVNLAEQNCEIAPAQNVDQGPASVQDQVPQDDVKINGFTASEADVSRSNDAFDQHIGEQIMIEDPNCSEIIPKQEVEETQEAGAPVGEEQPTAQPPSMEECIFPDEPNLMEDTSQSDKQVTPGEAITSDLHNEMPEFFRPPHEKQIDYSSIIRETTEMPDEIGQEEGEIAFHTMAETSFLRCSNCQEEFELSLLDTHPCFVRGIAMEYSEVENTQSADYLTIPMYSAEGQEMIPISELEQPLIKAPRDTNRRRIPRIPAQENIHYPQIQEPETKMHCKTCYAEFRSINMMRQHWDLTGHSREVSTTTIELNKIKDKYKKTEQTFKVVKQNFNIRANVIGQNDEDIRRNDVAYTNCIVKIKETPSIEEYMLRRDGKMCETCGVIFGDAELLFEHKCLTCVGCQVEFMNHALLKKHYQYTGHSTKAFKKENPSEEQSSNEHPVVHSYDCPKCSKTFPARLALSKHLKTHYRGTNKGACHYCLFEFDDKSVIQQHVLEAHGAYLYKCEHCDRAFLTKSARNKHQLKHVIHVCKKCNIKFSAQRLLTSHMEKIHRSRACRICGKFIADPYALRRHEKRHFYQQGLKCDFCEKTFRNKSALRTHNDIHQDQIMFRCKTCSLGFRSPRSLETHEIVHIKKSYTCSKCGIVCQSRNAYWLHLKMHESAYKCGECGLLYRDTSLLAAHYKRKHVRARPYQCPKCPRVFSVPATLRRHLTVHTRSYPFKCGLCKKGFLTKYAYHKHLDRMHALQNTNPRHILHTIPSLTLNATDEDILQAADTLIAEDVIMFNDYQKDVIEQVSSSDLITEEVVVETTELFDEILN